MSEIDRMALIAALPYARRFARALTGSRAEGDALVADALGTSLCAMAGVPDPVLVARLALYRAILSAMPEEDAGQDGYHSGQYLSHHQRVLLLLTSLEEIGVPLAAMLLGLSPEAALSEIDAGRAHLHASAVARVLIIEDEPIIAMDLQQLVENAGHHVIGVASSEEEAVALALSCPPSLVLADVNLGAGGDGVTAVSRILASHKAPVIFVTAYPERLLTGHDVEPAFVIAKPFDPMALVIATYQAVTRGVQLDPAR